MSACRFARGDLRVEVHDDAPGWRPVRKRAAGEDGSGCCLALLDGLIGPYGGSRGVAHDSTGRRKTVYVMICLALTRRAGHPRMAYCRIRRARGAPSRDIARLPRSLMTCESAPSGRRPASA
jgi:hypothetical protein